jgi:signal transduction histidine kinase
VLNDGAMGEVWLFPVPSFAMEMEVDCFAIPSDLNSDSDFDVIPDGFKTAVKYYAANLLFLKLDLKKSDFFQSRYEKRLSQILSNLLTNASKYSEPGTPITVSLRHDGASVLMSVRDEGIGIAPDKPTNESQPSSTKIAQGQYHE